MSFAVYLFRIDEITANLYRVLNEPKPHLVGLIEWGSQKVIVDNVGHSTKRSAAKCARVRVFPILINSNQWIYVEAHTQRDQIQNRSK